MAYKDAERQKQASKEAMKRHRERKQGITSEGITPQGTTSDIVIPDSIKDLTPEQPCRCKMWTKLDSCLRAARCPAGSITRPLDDTII